MELREAAQMALDALDSDNPDIQLRAATHLRAALAAPPEELELPKVRLEEFLKLIEGKEDFRGIPLMRTEWPTRGEAREQPEPEELAQLEQAMIEAWKPIPQREWQGLTDEEIMKITGVTSADSDWNVTIVHKWIRAIEAKLREKNFDRPS